MAAGGILFDDGRILLVKQPAGYGFIRGPLQFNETSEQAAAREMREESSFIATPVRYIGRVVRPSREEGGEPVEKQIDLFAMQLIGQDPVHNAEKTIVWVPYDEAIARMWHPEESRFLEEHRSDFFGA